MSIGKYRGIKRLGVKPRKDVGALDYKAKVYRRLKQVQTQRQEKDYVRLVRDGNVAYKRGDEVLLVPPNDLLRERLIQLLESTGGCVDDPIITKFFDDRARAGNDPDDMKAEWANEVLGRLYDVWHELTTPPVSEADRARCPDCRRLPTEEHKLECPSQPIDVFEGFGL